MYDVLLKPFSLGSFHLANRVVMAPMTRNMSKHNIPGLDVADYYKRHAEGGVGLIITEGTAIGHKAAHGYPDVPSFCGVKPLEGWKVVVDAVHAAGGKIFPQLWHVGSVRQRKKHEATGVDNPKHVTTCDNPEIPGYAPSPIPNPSIENAEIPHEMTGEDIEEVINAFITAAKNAKELGFDGIELHGAHGYLIDQFFWPYTNKRTDRYGGKTLVERTRFAVELIERVREAVGPTYPICFRFSQWKVGDYDGKLATTPEELGAFLQPLSEAGVDIFHCSTRRFYDHEFPNSSLNLAGWTKKLIGKPTITVGSVGLDVDFIKQNQEESKTKNAFEHLKDLEESLEKEEFDLVAVGRAVLADPAWIKKVTEGRLEEIQPFSKDLLKKL